MPDIFILTVGILVQDILDDPGVDALVTSLYPLSPAMTTLEKSGVPRYDPPPI